MNNPATLDDYYRYWDEFYKAWYHNDMNAIKCLGWTDANIDGVTTRYLPEPWWGYSGEMGLPLESVVINFNPGPGGADQERHKFHCQNSYSGFVRDQVLRYVMKLSSQPILKTNSWHDGNRAKRIYEMIGKYVDVSTFTLKNHLSVELVPWHTTSSTEIVSYCAKNRKAIFEHSIKFAAEASTHIQNPILSGVVLLRMSSSFFKQIMGGIGGLNYVVQEKEIKRADTQSYYCIFEFLSIPGVWFVCIWGPKTRNNFPNSECMKEIIKQITILKLTNI